VEGLLGVRLASSSLMVAARTSQVPGWNWISLGSTVCANRSTASSASQAEPLARPNRPFSAFGQGTARSVIVAAARAGPRSM